MGAPAVEIWRWSADAFERAGEVGLFGHGVHAELIDGEVHVMSPQTPQHAYVLRVLLDAVAGMQDGYTATIQSPVRLSDQTEPAPDLCISVGPRERYADHHPGPEDIRLVVEVSVASLGYDLGDKLRSYARHAVPEVWVIDVAHRQVLVYRAPEASQGAYAQVEARTVGRVECLGLEVDIGDLWPAQG
ncbi:MAG: Uma2 family endonuclease [Actinomycetota bacterium]|jgi:Uma2 family endonuclease|nr:Uma2 family endonuclease [Actinomycetota bacterium]